MLEHDYEPIPGLPSKLPAGETILWQGAPEWRSLARRGFRTVQVGGYFAVLLAWYAVSGLLDGKTATPITTALTLVPLGACAIALLSLYAWLTARSTLYTITNRRVVLRFGIALPITINIPFVKIDAAGLRHYKEGTGDLTLTLKQGERIAYLVLWPHARPWYLSRAEPMLRCVPDGEKAGQILARAMAASADQPASAIPQTETGAQVAPRPATVAA
jgi:hypothetical protein